MKNLALCVVSTILKHLKIKKNLLIVVFLMAIINPTPVHLYKTTFELSPLTFIALLGLWVAIFMLLYMIVDIVYDFLTLFLPNARRIYQPISFVYKLRYRDGFSDDIIKMFLTEEWNELVRKVKAGKDETVLFEITPQ